MITVVNGEPQNHSLNAIGNGTHTRAVAKSHCLFFFSILKSHCNAFYYTALISGMLIVGKSTLGSASHKGEEAFQNVSNHNPDEIPPHLSPSEMIQCFSHTECPQPLQCVNGYCGQQDYLQVRLKSIKMFMYSAKYVSPCTFSKHSWSIVLFTGNSRHDLYSELCLSGAIIN